MLATALNQSDSGQRAQTEVRRKEEVCACGKPLWSIHHWPTFTFSIFYDTQPHALSYTPLAAVHRVTCYTQMHRPKQQSDINPRILDTQEKRDHTDITYTY